jgi:hypothetical protein
MLRKVVSILYVTCRCQYMLLASGLCTAFENLEGMCVGQARLLLHVSGALLSSLFHQRLGVAFQSTFTTLLGPAYLTHLVMAHLMHTSQTSGSRLSTLPRSHSPCQILHSMYPHLSTVWSR